MTTERLRLSINAQPFRPFMVKMANGDNYEIRHPETIMITTGGRTAYIAGEGEEVHIVDLLLMTELQILNAPAEAARGHAS